MTTTKKIIATGVAIAFAATLSSCEMKKGEEKKIANSSEINDKSETADKETIPTKLVPDEVIPAVKPPVADTPDVEIQKDVPSEIIPDANKAQSEQDLKMKTFEDKQAKMGELFKEFEKNTPEFKALQDEMNGIFSSGKQPTEEDMKKIEETDAKIRELFTPEMKALDEELRQLGNEIFGQVSNQDTEADTQEPVTK